MTPWSTRLISVLIMLNKNCSDLSIFLESRAPATYVKLVMTFVAEVSDAQVVGLVSSPFP